MKPIVVSALTILLFGFFLAWRLDHDGVRADESIERQFELPSDPDTEVLRVTYAGGMTNLVTQHRIFGDGRFVVEIVSGVDGSMQRQYVLQLSDEALLDLIAIPAQSGLIEHDHQPYDKKLKLYHSSDGGVMIVDLHLDRYRGPGEHDWRSASVRISIRSAESARRHFPAVAVFSALASLSREVNRYRKRAEQAREQE